MELLGKLIFLVCFFNVDGASRIKKIMLSKLEGHPCGENDPVIFNFTRWTTEGSILTVDCILIVREDVRNPITQTVKIEKCKSRDNPDTCEDFHSFTISKYCETMSSTMWKPLYGSFKPKVKCPLLKGTYKSINTTIDISALLIFPATRYYWRFKSELMDKGTGRPFSCTTAECFF